VGVGSKRRRSSARRGVGLAPSSSRIGLGSTVPNGACTGVGLG
jgi:hypothetical protein